MIAIQTKYLGPTNHMGSRIKAFTQNKGQARTIGYPHELGVEAGHDAAARELIVKLGWFGVWVRGGSADGRGYVYTCAASEHEGPSSVLKCFALSRSIGDLCIYVQKPAEAKP